MEANFGLAFNVVHAIRSLRTQYSTKLARSVLLFIPRGEVSFCVTDLLPKQRPKVYVRLATAELIAKYKPFLADIATLGMAEEVVLLLGTEAPPTGCAVSILDQSTEVHMLLVGMVNPDDEIARLVRDRSVYVVSALTPLCRRRHAPRHRPSWRRCRSA